MMQYNLCDEPMMPAPAREELLRLYEEADALVLGATCTCTDAKDAPGAFCCHFDNIGREPYVTALEMAEVARAVLARGGLPKRRLPLAEGLRTCPLLSPAGRCTIYEARPLGCRTFFCEGHGPAHAPRKALLELGRRVAALSARAFPRSEGARPFTRALRDLGAR
jgi:Fe-S-cluster containining protein